MLRASSNGKRRCGTVAGRRPLALESLEPRLPLSHVTWNLVAASGFNDQVGLESDPAPDSPYVLGGSIAQRGSGESGWDSGWSVSRGGISVDPSLASAESFAAFEGDAGLDFHGSPSTGSQGRTNRKMDREVVGTVRIEQRVQLLSGALQARPLTEGYLPNWIAIHWQISDGRFWVNDGPGHPNFEDTGILANYGQWYFVATEIDFLSQTWDFFVDDVKFDAPDPLGFRHAVPQITEINYLISHDGNAFIDELRVFEGVETPTVTLTVDATTIGEDAGTATFTATASTIVTQPVVVELAFSGSATMNADYAATGTQILIPAGATSGSITVAAADDLLIEEHESIVVDIVFVTNASEAGEQREATVIIDDELPSAYAEAVLADSPIGYWRLGELVGPTALDSSANGLDGTYVGGMTLGQPGALSGDADRSALFDGDTGLVDVGVHSRLNQLANAFSIDAWIRPASDGGGWIVSTRGLGGGYGFHVVENEMSFTTFGIKDYFANGVSVPALVWTHVAVVFDSSNDTSFFVNGQFVEKVEGNSSARRNSQTLYLGGEPVPGSAGIAHRFHGEIDEVAIYDRPLTSEEIREHYLAGVSPTQLTVVSLEQSSTGFSAQFNGTLDVGGLNLFDTETAQLGPADIVLRGTSFGVVPGSVVVDPSHRGIRFVKTGDPLAPDTYTVMLRSAADGFKGVRGQSLDGDGDGIAGGDFTAQFVVEARPPDSVTLTLPDFVRGPGQIVNVPADTTNGIPLSISDGSQVKAIDVRISYDPRLLNIIDATVANSAPGGSMLTINNSDPGSLILSFVSPTSLPAGRIIFANLEARIPDDLENDLYSTYQKLDIHTTTVSDGNDNEFEVTDDDALHVAAYFGDVSGNGRVNARDASLVARVSVQLDSGFASTPLVDPLIVADISGNGRINASDTSKIARAAARLSVPEIPDFETDDGGLSPVQWGGNGHYYGLVSPRAGISWTDAREAAEKLTLRGTHGHLVTVNSADEWEFLLDTFNKDLTWIGLTDEESEGTFRWVTGEPLEFTAWGVFPQEPNNAGTGVGEDYVHIGHRTTGVGWNDFPNRDNVYGFPTSYIVEFPVPKDPSSVVIAATSSIWLAGQPVGAEIFGNSAPSQSPVSIDLRSLSQIGSLQFAVSGETSRNPDLSQFPLVDADGELRVVSLPGPHFQLSGALAPHSSLVGLFLDSDHVREVPERLDFSSSSLRSFGELSPALQQVFFIGDGLTGLNEGTRQRFMIPPNADTLYLGVLDSQSANNVGQLMVTVLSS